MREKVKKRVAVFDFDGTLVDSMDEFAEIASEVMPKFYDVDKETARKLYLSTSGIPFFAQLETLFPGNKSNEVAAKEFETIKKENYLSKKAFSDASDTLRELRKRKIKVIISSNNFQELVNKLVGKLDIECDMVLGYKTNFAKGADHFRHIIKETGCSNNELIFIGDSLKDAEKAANFGIEFIGKEGFFKKEDFTKHQPRTKVIKTLSELKEILI